MSMNSTNAISKKQLNTKISLFIIGIPMIASSFLSRVLPDAMSPAVGLFIWCMIFHFVPPKWSNRTFAQGLALSTGIALLAYALVSLINHI